MCTRVRQGKSAEGAPIARLPPAAAAATIPLTSPSLRSLVRQARLQQQISALQKRLLQTQITELQNTVLIGGRQIDPSASPSLASAAAEDDLLTPGAADDAPPTEKLRAERRKTDRLDGRVRALTGRVHELQAELAQSRRALQRSTASSSGRSGSSPLRTLPNGGSRAAAAAHRSFGVPAPWRCGRAVGSRQS